MPEHVAVGLCTHTGHPARVGEQTDLTKVGSVRQRGGNLAVVHDDVHDALLDINDIQVRIDSMIYYVVDYALRHLSHLTLFTGLR